MLTSSSMRRYIISVCYLCLGFAVQVHAKLGAEHLNYQSIPILTQGRFLSIEPVEPTYQFLFFWRTRNFVLASSEIKQANKSSVDPAINQVGLFKTEYAIRMQHALYKYTTLGLTGILGKKGYDQKQLALYLIVRR